MKTIPELLNEIALLNTATFSSGQHKGQRIVEHDPVMRREVFNLRVEVAEAEKAEGLAVRINEHQRHGMGSRNNDRSWQQNPDLKSLAKAQGAVNEKTGKRHYEESPQLRAEIEQARTNVFSGERTALSPQLSELIK